MRADASLYDRLASSVAPNVFGHVDVKRAVLLMLLGGVQKQTKEVRAAVMCCGVWVFIFIFIGLNG
jgi:DNA replicative helicase MCM subunit Mcm2 (Cdc46/Mcm family)